MNRRIFFEKSIYSATSLLLAGTASIGRVYGENIDPDGLPKRVKNVNTTDIVDAIRLGCRTMQNVFNADDHNIPFFSSCVWPDPQLGFHPYLSEAHIPGRHLNGLLNAEDVIGVKLDEKAVENHRNAALFSYSGILPLPLNRNEEKGPLVNFLVHNLREGFHALYSLVKYRNDKAAQAAAEKSIETILDFWNLEQRWDQKRIAGLGINLKDNGFIRGEARMIGSLVKYYRATGYGPALELALMLKEKAITEVYLPDGSYAPERFNAKHSHSITCVMSSLAQLADLLNDSFLMNRVKVFYDHGLQNMRDEIGWSPESVFQKGSDHGESNNTGDILETALILGRWGYTEYYQDAERIIRCHLLPSQLRDVSFIVAPPNPNGIDGLRNIADRHLGAWGFPAPYGHKSVGKGRRGKLSFNMDIVGGVVGSLCEACRETARTTDTGTWVNMLFDYETNEVKVKSPYTNDCLSIELKRPGALFIRIPSWLNVDEIEVKGIDIQPVFSNSYIYFNQVPANQAIQLHFPLKETQLVLSESVHLQPIRVKMKGDSVLAIDNFGAKLTFFDSL